MMLGRGGVTARRRTGVPVLAMNIGGTAYTSPIDGISYIADQHVTNVGKNGYTLTGMMGAYPDPPVWESCRFGEFAYSIPVTNGSYDIALKMADIWEGPVAAGGRVFTLVVQGVSTASIDINALAGGQYKPYTLVVTRTVTTGALTISAVNGVNDPVLNAVVIMTR